MNVHHDTATPTLSVKDPRALVIRSVGYCRHPDKPAIESRITRQIFDAAGRMIESWDPRLWGTAPKPNQATIFDLNGDSLLTDSVDAGWQLSLSDQAGSLRSFWDGRGNQRHIDYDDQQRPITVTEQTAGDLPQVVERLTYGGAGPVFAEHNQCGRLIRHDSTAGSQRVGDYGLTGSVLMESRRFLTELETPDWPDEEEAREELLEEQSFVTRYAFLPTGEIQRQIDAMGNARTFGYDVAGKLSEVWLLLTGDGKQPQCLVSNIRHNANDQIESETAGNGVETRAEYDAENGRLTRLVAAVGNQKPLQDLNYLYDPIGNIVEMEDKSQSVTHFNNQRIEPINRYRYDSLYQLVEAKGWEVSNPSHGPALPQLLPTPLDPNQRRNYTQQFDYNPAGNLISRRHSGAPGFSMFTSAGSNRSLAQREDGALPGEPEITSGFDACGNQLELQRGQAMVWDIRNQLSRVTLVKREGEPGDYECYVYDRPGHRLRKVHFSLSKRLTLRAEVRYLPGLEVHRQADGEERHVISVDAGRSSVRALHWPEGTHDDQLRYSFSDHLGSSTLELDDEAGVLTQEHYYPFGGTACWAAKSELVAKYKTIRYSGKERDATGLYCYGFRYYAPWLQRWISPDPAWDGLNVFEMVGNSPPNFFDPDGLTKEAASKRWRAAYDAVAATNSGVRVRTVVPGIIAVDVVGGNELFNRMGVGLTRDVNSDRRLSYLSIDASLKGKVAGGVRPVHLKSLSGAAIKSEAGKKNAGAMAFINGGFFNMGGGASKDAPGYASVGPNVIDGRRREYANIPQDYRSSYVKIRMDDLSMIHSGPVLSDDGKATFPQQMLSQPRFQFTDQTSTPGKLGHASAPNARSGISLPSSGAVGQRTRLAMGTTEGRTNESPGYTMPEWSMVMARLDRLNGSGGQSVNLDGGYSTVLGVVGAEGQSLMTRSYPGAPDRAVGNFIAYYQKSPGFSQRLSNTVKSWFS
ncbi:RHS repeat-associated core domain-containing protein [Pseudomonas sp. LS2P72]